MLVFFLISFYLDSGMEEKKEATKKGKYPGYGWMRVCVCSLGFDKVLQKNTTVHTSTIERSEIDVVDCSLKPCACKVSPTSFWAVRTPGDIGKSK